MNSAATPCGDGGPAFPINDPQSAHATAMAASLHIEDPAERERAYILARAAAVIGMSTRDFFTAAAITGICAHPDNWGLQLNEIGAKALEVADSALKARSA